MSSENLPFCPYCRAENVAKIFYGLPLDDFSDDSEFEENLRSGKLVLGGCCVTPMTHRCNVCKRDFAFPGNENEEEALVDALDAPHFCAAQSSEDYARAMEVLGRYKPRRNVDWADFFYRVSTVIIVALIVYGLLSFLFGALGSDGDLPWGDGR